MRYEASQGVSPDELPIYSESSGLHFMLNFTVALALIIGIALWVLARHGKVLWLKVWSIGLVVFSAAYLLAAMTNSI
jgi:hypothetical protein